MGVNTNKLKGRMREMNITQAKMIEEMRAAGHPISRAAFNSKICGRSEFKVNEFLTIASILEISDVGEYLFV